MQEASAAAADSAAHPMEYKAAAQLAAVEQLHKRVEARPKSAAAFVADTRTFLPWLLHQALQWAPAQAAQALSILQLTLSGLESSSR